MRYGRIADTKSFMSFPVVLPVLALGLLLSAPPAVAETIHRWSGEGNANDSVGDAHGTLVGGTSFGEGFLGQGFVFGGNGDSVSLGSGIASFGTADFTVAFAIKNPGPIGKTQILSQRAACLLSSFWDIRSTLNGTLNFEIRTSNADAGVNTMVPIDDGNFHTVVFTRNGPVSSAYIDGLLTARNTAGFVANVSNAAALPGEQRPVHERSRRHQGLHGVDRRDPARRHRRTLPSAR